MPWQKGKSGNPKGSKLGGNPGCGRPPDWLRNKCQKIIDRDKLVDFLAKVARGDNMEQIVTDQGETVSVPAPVKERLRATDMLLDRGYGKPSQPIEASGNFALNLIEAAKEAREKRGLKP